MTHRTIEIDTTPDQDLAIADAFAWHVLQGGPSADESGFLSWALQQQMAQFDQDVRTRASDAVVSQIFNGKVALQDVKAVTAQAASALSATVPADPLDPAVPPLKP